MTSYTVAAPRRQQSRAQPHRIWEMEAMKQPSMTAEKQTCEQHFISNTTQRTDGRFVVRLPTRMDPKQLGSSRLSAERRLHAIEGRMER